MLSGFSYSPSPAAGTHTEDVVTRVDKAGTQFFGRCTGLHLLLYPASLIGQPDDELCHTTACRTGGYGAVRLILPGAFLFKGISLYSNIDEGDAWSVREGSGRLQEAPRRKIQGRVILNRPGLEAVLLRDHHG